MTKLRAKRIQIEPRSGGILLAPGFRGCCSTPLEQNVIPFFAKKGWTRPKENAAKHPLRGADGVVVSSYRLCIPNGFDKRWLETTTPSALNKERGHFSLWRSHPFFAKKGITFCSNNVLGNSPANT
jgi:hypothetical protein